MKASYTKDEKYYTGISAYVRHVRADLSEAEPYSTIGAKWTSAASGPLVAESRAAATDFMALLSIYEKSGLEWSKSFQGERLVERVWPRRGALHKHEYIEILYVIEGTFSQIILGEMHTFKKGSFVITDQNCEHADHIDARNSSVIFMQIRADYMDRLLNGYDHRDEVQRFLFHALSKQKKSESILVLEPNDDLMKENDAARRIDHLLMQIFEEDTARDSGYLQTIDAYMKRLLAIMCSCYSTARFSASAERKEADLLYELERYIRLNLADVTVADLERQFHYHRNYYSALLKKYRGMTCLKYIQSLKMLQAKNLIESTDLPIRQIAQQAGYENMSFFYHLFEKTYGLSPSQLRGR